EQALQEGLQPLQSWVKRLINKLIVNYWGYTDIEFTWLDAKDIDPLQQAQIDQIYLQNGVKTPDEVRANLGLDPLTPEQKAELEPVPPVAPQIENNNGEPTIAAQKILKKKVHNCGIHLY
ncbi:MAG: phage head morphogenesis protein, partial [Pseudomonadota bacterium]